MGDEYDLSGKQAFRRVEQELKRLPGNEWLTTHLCDRIRFSRILILDGKYIAVKGFDRKIPFLYGIDYLTHDIPLGELYAAEDEAAFSQFFTRLKRLGYRPRIVVADDRAGLKGALTKVFPGVLLQLCQTHYLENIRNLLRVRTEEKYQQFFNSLRLHVFQKSKDEDGMIKGLQHVLAHHAGSDARLQNIVAEIYARRAELFNYFKIKDCPSNTNLIELYNSHLQGRLKTIKGFQSFESARIWLNAYLIRRRTKPLTDCKTKFKRLNGHAALAWTIKKQAQWPERLKRLGINKTKYYYFYESGG